MLTKHIRILIIFTVLAGLIFSTSVALANFSNGPENPGPIVFRGQTEFGVFYADYKEGLIALHGADVVEYCQNPDILFPIVDFQDILSPSDTDRIITLIHGDDVPTSVWPFVDFDCELFLSEQPIATGTVDLVATDNDVFAFFSHEIPNMNAFTLKAHGKLAWTNGEGGVARFNGHSNCIWDGFDTPDSRFKCKDKINIH